MDKASRKFIDLIFEASSKRATFNPSYQIMVGDYGTIGHKTAEFEKVGNIYINTSIFKDGNIVDLVKQNPPQMADREEVLIATSPKVKRADLNAGANVDIPGLVNASIKGRWTFGPKQGALLVMAQPQSFYIPHLLLKCLVGVEALINMFLVTEAVCCPAYSFYLSNGNNEVIDLALLGSFPVPNTPEVTTAGEANVKWWSQNTAGLFRSAHNPHGKDDYTPLFVLRVIAKKRGILSRRGRTIDPHPASINDGHKGLNTTTSEPVRMFGPAHDINISGGDFYTAENINIHASHNKDSDHLTNIYHLWQLNHTWKLPENAGERVECHLEGCESDLCPGIRIGQRESETPNDGAEVESHQDENEYPPSDLNSPAKSSEYELENHHEQDLQIVIIPSTASSSPDQTLADEIVYDILSNYPRQPTGNHRLFERILQALVVSFSPLSSPTISALLNFSNAQHVEQVLLPAYPLVFVPNSEGKIQGNDDRTPVRFIYPSIVEFFLDRTRGGQYFVDMPSAHRVLLDRCQWVMEKVYRERQDFNKLGCGWRDAYEYACQYWEDHRRAGTRSKL